ncbi:hypothetical protein [Sulfitobacter sp. PM12]|uniref:hypothetical protein n=1 Tax=Sulfitobacter sp. PM12 TaxID=3138497 RepID=UPI00388F21FE
MMLKRYVFAGLVTCFASTSHAADGPSYDKTVNFIQSKLLSGAFPHRRDGDSVSFDISNCVISKEIIDYGSNSSSSPYRYVGTYTWSLSLSQIDPSTARVTEYDSIDLGVTGRANSVRQVNSYADGRTERKFYHLFEIGTREVKPPSSDSMPRVARALQHLVNLCGGAEELF